MMLGQAAVVGLGVGGPYGAVGTPTDHTPRTVTSDDAADDADGMPKLCSRGQRGGRRGKKHKPAATRSSLIASGVPLMTTAEELRSCVTAALDALPHCTTPPSRHSTDPATGYPGCRSPVPSPSSQAAPTIAVTPMRSRGELPVSGGTYPAWVGYQGPCLADRLPLAVPLPGGEQCSLDLFAGGSQQVPKLGVAADPVLTLFGRVYVQAASICDVNACVLLAIHRISPECCRAVKLVSRVVQTSSTPQVRCLQFLVECGTLQGAALLIRCLHERRVSLPAGGFVGGGGDFLFTFEYTTQRGGAGERVSVYKPLYVAKDKRAQPWSPEEVAAREDHMREVEAVKLLLLRGGEGGGGGVPAPVLACPAMWSPCSNLTPTLSPCPAAGGATTPQQQQQYGTASEFPSDPSPPYLCFPSDPATALAGAHFGSGGGASVPHIGFAGEPLLACLQKVDPVNTSVSSASSAMTTPESGFPKTLSDPSSIHESTASASCGGAEEVNHLVTAALSTVASSVDLPWTQKAAVMLGAAAYAVVSGHWVPPGGHGADACGGCVPGQVHGGAPARPNPPRPSDVEGNWKQLISQLHIPMPNASAVSTPTSQPSPQLTHPTAAPAGQASSFPSYPPTVLQMSKQVCERCRGDTGRALGEGGAGCEGMRGGGGSTVGRNELRSVAKRLYVASWQEQSSGCPHGTRGGVRYGEVCPHCEAE